MYCENDMSLAAWPIEFVTDVDAGCATGKIDEVIKNLRSESVENDLH